MAIGEKKSGRASRYAAPIGGIFVVLCTIGFFSLIGGCFTFTRNLLDNSNTKRNYDSMLLPVVMFDPPPFENPTTLRTVDLLMYSLWSAALGENRDVYEYDDNMALVIPASDVEMAAFQLFGPEVELTHDTFGDYTITYYYDTTTKSYHVPVNALTGFYTPLVEEIYKKGDVMQLKVGYIPPATAMTIDLTGSGERKQTPDKYMIYELKKGKKEYYLYAIRDLNEGGNNYLLGTDANPEIQDYLDDFNTTVTEEPEAQLEFKPASSESASESGADGSSSSGASGSEATSGTGSSASASGSSSSSSASGSSSSASGSSGSSSTSGSSGSSSSGSSKPPAEVQG
ncbi:MAG: hypothetical protein RR276_01620 [Angelakisella sp.]